MKQTNSWMTIFWTFLRTLLFAYGLDEARIMTERRDSMRPSHISEQSILFIRFISSSEITYLSSEKPTQTPLRLSSNTIFRVTNSTQRLLRIGPTTVVLRDEKTQRNSLCKRRRYEDIERNNTRLLDIFRLFLRFGNKFHSVNVLFHWGLRNHDSRNGMDMWNDFCTRFTLTKRFYIFKKTI